MLVSSASRASASFTEQVQQSLQHRQFQEAISLCQHFLTQYSESSSTAEVYRLLGNAWQGLGQAEKAGNCYARALEFQPRNAEIYANLGSLAATQQHWKAAIQHLQKALSLNPKFAGAYRNLARVWEKLNRELEALEAWYEALRLDAASVPLSKHQQVAEVLFARGEWTRAIECWQQLPDRDPKLRQAAYQKMAQALAQLGKVREAQMCLQVARGGSVDTLAGASGADTLAAVSHSVRPRGVNGANGSDTLAAVSSARRDTLAAVYRDDADDTRDVLLPQSDLELLAQVYCDRKQWVKAIQACQGALRVRRNPQIYKLFGNALQATGRLVDAERAYREALRLQPRFAEVYANIASLYAQQRQWSRAIQAYRQALGLKPRFAGAYRNFAKVWEKVGDEARAVECWDRALDIEPEWAKAPEHLALGNRWVKLGKLQRAEGCYRRALSRNARFVDAWHNLGEVLSYQQKWQPAREAFEEALTQQKERVSSRLSLGRVLVSLEAWDAAIECYGHLAEIDPQQVLAQQEFGRLLWEQERREDAIAVYRRALVFAPNVFELNVGLAEALWELERWEEAIEVYDRLRELKPQDGLMQAKFAEALLKVDRVEEAIAVLERSLAVCPQEWYLHHVMGDARSKQEKWKKAVKAYKRAIAINPNFSWSHHNLGEALMRREKFKAAVKAYQQATRLNPEFKWSFFHLGRALLEVERFGGAVRAFKQAKKLDATTPWSAKHLGDALQGLAMANAKEAVEWYRQAIDEDPGDLQNYHKALDLKSDDAELYVKLADELARQGQDDGATVFYQMALQLQLDDSEVVQHLEEVLKKKLELTATRFDRKSILVSGENLQHNKHNLRNVNVIVPVYKNLKVTKECLERLIKVKQIHPYEITVINDCSPEPEISNYLNTLASSNSIALIEHINNEGFVKSVNEGMRYNLQSDIVLLNSDAYVTDYWLDYLQEAVYRYRNVATATPLSNNATIFSYPILCQECEDIPNDVTLEKLAKICNKVNQNIAVEVPSGHGFCLYIRREALIEVGDFDAETWGQGYGEEVDWCQQALRLGWQHIAVPMVFVQHVGSQSFAEDKTSLLSRSLRLMSKKYPKYDAIVQEFIKSDPLAAARRNIDLERLKRFANRFILIIVHNLGGGTEKHINDMTSILQKENIYSLIIKPAKESNDWIELTCPNLNLLSRYNIHKDTETLIRDLKLLNVFHIHIHHFIGFTSDFIDRLIAGLNYVAGLNYDITLHDYMVVCPRVTLSQESGRYCQEPSIEVCEVCVRKYGVHQNLKESFKKVDSVLQWRLNFQKLLQAARKVFVPSQDMLERIRKHFPKLKFTLKYHPEAIKNVTLHSQNNFKSTVRVGLIGNISEIKGLKTLYDCAEYASSIKKDIEFIVIGTTSNNSLFERFSNCSILGSYTPENLSHLISRSKLDFAAFFSTWPETYCYTLSEALENELHPFAFNIGAVGERIHQLDCGYLINPDTNVIWLVEALYNFGLQCRKTQQSIKIGNYQLYSSFANNYY